MEAETNKKFYLIGNYLCLDFINTEAMAEGRVVNLLSDFNDFVSWLIAANVIDTVQAEEIIKSWKGKSETEKVLLRVLEFRASLRQMIERLVKGKSVPTKTITFINDLLNNQVSYAELRRVKGKFEKRTHASFNKPEHLLLPTAESACDLLCYGDFSLIKKCENDDCILFFYDTTKNHSRRWCRMSACGNRMKVAAHYHRLREMKRT